MSEKYITIKVRVEDHKKLKVKAAESGVSMMDMFSESLNDGWRPMRTAPKDGTVVILWLGGAYKEAVMAWWYDAWENWQTEGLSSVIESDEHFGIGSAIPTHWMPLPGEPEKLKV